MKTTIKVVARISLLIAVAGLVSCGATTPNQNTSGNTNSMGQTERLNNEEMLDSMNEPTQAPTEDAANIAPIEAPLLIAQGETPDVPLVAPQGIATPDANLGLLAPPFANPEALLDEDAKYYSSANPYLGTPPYYCSPKYGAHIVSSIAACHPYLNYYGTSWGYNRYLNRLYDRPGYRVRRHLGRRGYYNDDDDDDTENRGPRKSSRRGGKKRSRK